MKQLILILISCLAFAQPQKLDTAGLAPEVKAVIMKIETEKKKADLLDHKLQAAEAEKKKAERERASLYSRFKSFFHEYFGSDEGREKAKQKSSAVKEENRIDPVEEVEVYDGTDTVQAGWFYRLFHKNDFVIRRFKIVNNEKVYLD